MKKITLIVLAASLFTACNSSDKKNGNSLKVTADSLRQQVINIHNVGMRDYMRIEKMQETIKRILDSIAVLPAKAKASAEPLKAKLNEAMDALTRAYDAMYSWMPTLNLDSAKNDLQKRIDYFTKEKLNAENINQALSNSLQRADSLVKTVL